MEIVSIFILFVTAATMANVAFWMLNIEVSYRQSVKITNAIYVYQIDTAINHRKRPLVDFCDKERFDDTIRRWWDFSYKRILPPDKLAIIEPYIPLVSSSDKYEKTLKGHTIHSIDDIALILNGGLTPMESKKIDTTKKIMDPVTDPAYINDRPEPMDKQGKEG